MSKKTMLKAGIVLIVLSLSVSLNFIFSDKDNSNFIFDNIEAFANDENPDFKPDCVATGYICTGRNPQGQWGDHHGLTLNRP